MARTKNDAATNAPAQASSRDKLLRAAERVIIDAGPQSASIRRIAAQAGVNVSLIGYHFGGLDQLLATLMHLNIDRFLGTETQMLAQLLSAKRRPTLQELLTVYLRPLWVPAVFNSDERSAAVVDAIHRHASAEVRSTAEQRLRTNFDPLLQQITSHVPRLEKRKVILRLCAISAAAMNVTPRIAAMELLLTVDGKDAMDEDAIFREMLSIAIGIMKAPALAESGPARVKGGGSGKHQALPPQKSVARKNNRTGTR